MPLHIVYSPQTARWELQDDLGTLLERLYTLVETCDPAQRIEPPRDYIMLTEVYNSSLIEGLEPHHEWWIKAYYEYAPAGDSGKRHSCLLPLSPRTRRKRTAVHPPFPPMLSFLHIPAQAH